MGQTAWGWLTVIYLFLSGLGAGAFLTAAFFELSGWRYERDYSPTCLTGATVSGPMVALGSLLLIFDLGAGKLQPWRIFYMFTHFRSVMTWGIWILSIFIPLGLIYGLLELIEVEPFIRGLAQAWLRPKVRSCRRLVAIVGSIFAVGTAVHTGVLISAVGPAVPLWSQPLLPFLPVPLLPVLFLILAISTGLGLSFDLTATIALRGIHEQTRSLRSVQVRIMSLIRIILISLETVLITLLFISALNAGGAAAESARLVLYGSFSVVFWVGVVLIGLVCPFLIYAYVIGVGHQPLLLGLISGLGVMIAGLSLRYLIIAAGIPAFL